MKSSKEFFKLGNVYIITEDDRKTTTIMLTSEY